jgi:hypothetical protein
MLQAFPNEPVRIQHGAAAQTVNMRRPTPFCESGNGWQKVAGPFDAPTTVNSCGSARKKTKNLPKTSRIELVFEPSIPWVQSLKVVGFAGQSEGLCSVAWVSEEGADGGCVAEDRLWIVVRPRNQPKACKAVNLAQSTQD